MRATVAALAVTAAASAWMGVALAGETAEASSVLRCVGGVKAGAPVGALSVMVRWLGCVGGEGESGGDGRWR